MLRDGEAAERAEVALVDLVLDGNAGLAELREHGAQILDAKADHQRTWEVIGVGREWRPHVLTADHEASVVASGQLDAGPVQWTDQDSCTGPFISADRAICPASDEQGFIASTYPISTTGCP